MCFCPLYSPCMDYPMGSNISGEAECESWLVDRGLSSHVRLGGGDSSKNTDFSFMILMIMPTITNLFAIEKIPPPPRANRLITTARKF